MSIFLQYSRFNLFVKRADKPLSFRKFVLYLACFSGRGVTVTFTIRVRETPGSNPGVPTGWSRSAQVCISERSVTANIPALGAGDSGFESRRSD